jgi:signal transduction histidine kinase
MLEAMPGPAMVLNTRRQVVVMNQYLVGALGLDPTNVLAGEKPGDVFGCLHSQETPGGCGSTESCEQCGANRAILECVAQRTNATHECRIQSHRTTDGGALDFRVHATFVDILGEDFIILGLENLASEKRRHVLERTFFHDLLNSCGGMQGLAELLADPDNDDATEIELKQDLRRLSTVVIEQIVSQRQLLAAERGELSLHVRPVDLRTFLEEVVSLYRHHEVAQGRALRLEMAGAGVLPTDTAILGRVVGNLVKNALEATSVGGEVVVRCEPGIETSVISVRNPGLIPRAVQLQIFQRSFSTKGGEGRGIGTYSVRLFAEQYLLGRVGFESTGESGTVFELTLPHSLQERAAA